MMALLQGREYSNINNLPALPLTNSLDNVIFPVSDSGGTSFSVNLSEITDKLDEMKMCIRFLEYKGFIQQDEYTKFKNTFTKLQNL